ncbi:YqiA/YcfP family alpha/beta fold hydrolase [Winogradskyella psychrotolerans]|uniref:YqiA/YcfP family alpha/beta fold hydrolase n=1 Tax=Winogradskyella psychrotolerans TaxID=1344585 RepID=UPI001C078965|nr:YqiA/YcfP family alpha/beta fold hydrolase [Winogradskyella psychrotolerans]MBU2928288.1 alpha/beta hydrolase [Winogradskyella psychrotolerans]
MNILYIHGLNGSLSPEKRSILEQYGVVYAPSIDYENQPSVISNISADFSAHDINVVIGSSMGGFTGYYISNGYQCPALLFNPALAKRSVYQEIPEIDNKKSILKYIVLGTEDDVVNPADTLQFLASTISYNPEYNIHLRNDLAHRIPIPIFEDEVKIFFNML